MLPLPPIGVEAGGAGVLLLSGLEALDRLINDEDPAAPAYNLTTLVTLLERLERGSYTHFFYPFRRTERQKNKHGRKGTSLRTQHKTDPRSKPPGENPRIRQTTRAYEAGRNDRMTSIRWGRDNEIGRLGRRFQSLGRLKESTPSAGSRLTKRMFKTTPTSRRQAHAHRAASWADLVEGLREIRGRRLQSQDA